LERLPLTEIPNTEASDKLVEGLRQDSDSIHAFLSQECKKGQKYWIPKKTLYDSYLRFCLDTGRTAHKPHGFIRHLRSQGYKEARKGDSREACWKGIALK